MQRPQQSVGEWEDRARLFLVRTAGNTAEIGPVLAAIEQQLPSKDAVRAEAWFEIDRARGGLRQTDEGLHFLMMFVWDVEEKCFRPFVSPTFEERDAALRTALINEMVDLSIRYKANGIAVRTFGKPPQALIDAVFQECQSLIQATKASMASMVKH